MTTDDVTDEETAKIAGILESKFNTLADDKRRLTAENESLALSLGLTTKDRDYWRSKAELRERERDAARGEREYMLQQWLGVYAIANEVKTEVETGRVTALDAHERDDATRKQIASNIQ